jgi:hypothetical protein
VSTDLARGQHTFVLRIVLGARKDAHLRFELVETAGSRGQARFIDGK